MRQMALTWVRVKVVTIGCLCKSGGSSTSAADSSSPMEMLAEHEGFHDNKFDAVASWALRCMMGDRVRSCVGARKRIPGGQSWLLCD